MGESAGFGRRCGNITAYMYDADVKLVPVSEPGPAGSSCEHDEGKRVFRLTEPDGKATECHDRAVRFHVGPRRPGRGGAVDRAGGRDARSATDERGRNAG